MSLLPSDRAMTIKPHLTRGDEIAAKEAVRQKDEAVLRDALKRCSVATQMAAWEFRRTGKLDYLPAVVVGVIERYVEIDLRPMLSSPRHDLRLVDDLQIDSLTMMEIVLLAEEVFSISIDYDDLRLLRTLGDIQKFVESKVRALGAAGHPRDFEEVRSWAEI
jgi:acyl carrier protein